MIALLLSTIVVTVHFGTVRAATTWTQTYGGVAAEEGNSLVETSDGGYAIVGSTESFGAGETDVWLVKTDAFGTVEWNITHGGSDYDFGRSLVVTSDGGYAIAGYTGDIGAGVWSDFWLIKTDAYGNEEWNQTYGGIKGEWLYSMVETQDGGYAMVGTWDLPIFGGSGWTNNSWLVKTDEDGNMEWNQTYTGGNAHSLIATSDGGYAIASTRYYDSNDAGGWTDFWLIKTDEFGTVEWNMTYGGSNEEEAFSLVETSDGGYAIVGTTQFSDLDPRDMDNGIYDYWLVKTDEDGNMEWNQTYGGEKIDEAYSLVEASDGGYAIAGYTTSYGAGVADFWLVKTDEFGVVPEATWVILPLLLVATVSIFICNKKLHQFSKEK